MSYKTTIADIARELNTTAATVSRALSNHPRISDKTKKSVQLTATKLNYNRNRVASSLRLGKTHLIGVIIPSAEINFFGSVVHGIESIANFHGYNVLLYQSNESREYEEKGIKTLLSARVDGILVSLAKGTTNYAHFEQLQKRKFPVVFFDRTIDDPGIASVLIDDFKGAYMATQHLIRNGYKRIAHIAGPGHLKNFSERVSGYKKALEDNNMPADESLIYYGSVSIASGREGAHHFLSLPVPPDAIFATEDFTALGVIKELKERLIRIPEDFGIVGFANEQFGEHITPTLSTVDQQTIQMGRSALGLLIDLIERGEATKEKSHKIVLEPALICRDSSSKTRRSGL